MPERKPTRTADLDYFYGQSSELFSFYRIPKLLFQDSRFQPLSTDAKTLYGILLDRMSLSARNGWLDKAGRVFIIYTVQEVQDSLEKERERRIKINTRIESLERRIQEAEAAEVNEMVRTAKVTPEQLAALLRQSANTTPTPAALSAVGATFNKEESDNEDGE